LFFYVYIICFITAKVTQVITFKQTLDQMQLMDNLCVNESHYVASAYLIVKRGEDETSRKT
jgi:hypothetical protein